MNDGKDTASARYMKDAIPGIIERIHNLDQEEGSKRTEQSSFVPVKEIIDNDWDLSINKNKKVKYVAVEYPPTSGIFDEIDRLIA